MKIKIFKTNGLGRIEFSLCELEELLNEVYNEGYQDAMTERKEHKNCCCNNNECACESSNTTDCADSKTDSATTINDSEKVVGKVVVSNYSKKPGKEPTYTENTFNIIEKDINDVIDSLAKELGIK